jgi:hypothetical protein
VYLRRAAAADTTIIETVYMYALMTPADPRYQARIG